MATASSRNSNSTRPTLQQLPGGDSSDAIAPPGMIQRGRSGGMSRGKGQLKLTIGKFSSRCIISQQLSVRDFLQGKQEASTNNNNNNNNNDLHHPSLEPELPPSPRSTPVGSRKKRPTGNSLAVPVSDLRQHLTKKCEESRRHTKTDNHMSFKWGSLRFSLNEQQEFGVPRRISSLMEVNEGEFVVGFDETNPHNKMGDSPNLADYAPVSMLSLVSEEDEEENDYDAEAEAEREEAAAAAVAAAAATSESGTTIEVAPGVHLPLRTPLETWAAVEEGRVTVTTCNHCKVELTCADDACLVMCADCWVFSPVDQAFASEQEAHDAVDLKNGSVSVGIQTEEIFEWLAIQEAADMLGG